MDLDRLGVRGGGCHLHFSNFLEDSAWIHSWKSGRIIPQNLPDDGEKVDVSVFSQPKKNSCDAKPETSPMQVGNLEDSKVNYSSSPWNF